MRVHKKSGLKNGQGTRPSGNQLSALETGLGGRKKTQSGSHTLRIDLGTG